VHWGRNHQAWGEGKRNNYAPSNLISPCTQKQEARMVGPCRRPFPSKSEKIKSAKRHDKFIQSLRKRLVTVIGKNACLREMKTNLQFLAFNTLHVKFMNKMWKGEMQYDPKRKTYGCHYDSFKKLSGLLQYSIPSTLFCLCKSQRVEA
jgi:hypothetical protein